MSYLVRVSEDYLLHQLWGYSCSGAVDLLRWKQLMGVYRREQLRGEVGCLDDCATIHLREEIVSVYPEFTPENPDGQSEEDFTIDDANYVAYINSGGCEVKDDFEQYLDTLVCNVSVPEFSVRAKETLCAIDIELIQDRVSCELYAEAEAIRKSCTISTDTTREKL